LLALALSSGAQNYHQDVSNASKTLLKQKNYALTVNYKVYLDGDMSKPFQQRHVDVKRKDNNVYMAQSTGLEVIDTENYQVMIDSKDKIFSARKKFSEENVNEQENQIMPIVQGSIDSMMILFSTIKIIQQTKNIIHYELKYKPNPVVEKAIMSINKTTGMYESVTVFYKEQRKVHELNNTLHKITVQVSYSNFKPNSVQNKDLFNEKNYLSINKKGKIEPVKKYSGYKLIIPENEE
jgi:hypothetical protein